MSRRKQRPTDPAEAARQRAAKRANPALWGVNEQAIASQADIADIPESRGKTRRVFRFDCFATLKLPEHDLACVRRLEDLIAVRYRVDGKAPGAHVDSSGSAELVTARSMAAGDLIDAVMNWTAQPWHGALIMALLTPQVVKGQRINWHKTVKNRLGLTDRDMQAKAVKQAAQALVEPFSRWDDGERPQRRMAA